MYDAAANVAVRSTSPDPSCMEQISHYPPLASLPQSFEHLDCLCMDDAYRHSELGQEVCIAALINLALYVELDSRKRGKCSIPKIKSKIDVPNHGITKVHVHHQLSVTLPQNVPKLWGG